MTHFSDRIPDPFIGFNEIDVGWVGEKSWTYRIVLPKVDPMHHNSSAFLAFDGLDTFATVLLNGHKILYSDNMFVSHRVDVTRTLRPKEENILEIEFESALLKARCEIPGVHFCLLYSVLQLLWTERSLKNIPSISGIA